MTGSTTPAPGAAKRLGPQALAEYARPNLGLSLLDIATSVVPYLALFGLMFWTVSISYLLTLAIAVPASGFLLRTYILFHDCTHGSFLPSRRLNAWLGAVLGLIVYTPFQGWRHSHAVHHATAGDLERRGVGDLPTMTVAEYNAAPLSKRLPYRLLRNPLVMFTIGPFYSLVIQPRMWSRSDRPRIKRSVIGTNILLVLVIAAFCLVFGWREYLLVQVPLVLMAGAAGVWLFYVQHQFEDTYWQSSDAWSYDDAALRGSSYLDLPQPLQWFSGNIGLHHVHHLNARIPNYNLQRAHDENAVFHSVPTLSLWDGLRTVRLKLWDEERGRLVGWAEARAAKTKAPAPGVAADLA
jgi:omega-6 fatty acid desaturase (delta-12 desaturase)